MNLSAMARIARRPFLFTLAVSAVIAASVFVKSFFYAWGEELGFSAFRSTHVSRTAINLTLFWIAFCLMRRLSLRRLGGLGEGPLENKRLWAAPLLLLLLAASNVFELDYSQVSPIDLSLLFLSTLSIGLFEEGAMRGLLQSYLIRHFYRKHFGILTGVLLSSLLFGLLHLVSFNQGLAEEFMQVCIATYIGVMFGALLLRTGRLYPIAVAHGLFDFFSGLDELKNSAEPALPPDPSFAHYVITLLALSPILFFGIYHAQRVTVDEIEEKLGDGGGGDGAVS